MSLQLFLIFFFNKIHRFPINIAYKMIILYWFTNLRVNKQFTLNNACLSLFDKMKINFAYILNEAVIVQQQHLVSLSLVHHSIREHLSGAVIVAAAASS